MKLTSFTMFKILTSSWASSLATLRDGAHYQFSIANKFSNCRCVYVCVCVGGGGGVGGISNFQGFIQDFVQKKLGVGGGKLGLRGGMASYFH